MERGVIGASGVGIELTLASWQVDDILGEGSDDSDSEKRKPEEEPERGPEHREPLTSGAPQKHPVLSAPSDKSAIDGRGPR